MKPDFNKIAIKIAEEVCVAVHTAPKGKGLDLVEAQILSGKEILSLSDKMLEIGKREDNQTFLRDGENIKQSLAVILIGTKYQRIGLRYCGLCGAKDCAESETQGKVCVFNVGDLGIAIGSAVSMLSDKKVDNRIMYTIGMAALESGIMDKAVKLAYVIPLSISGKNPFFDRKN